MSYNLRAHKLRYSNSSARRYARSYFTFATTLDGSNLLLPFLLIATSPSAFAACVFCCVGRSHCGLITCLDAREKRSESDVRLRAPMLKFGPVYFSFTCIKKLSLSGSTLQELSSSTSTLLLAWTSPRAQRINYSSKRPQILSRAKF